MGIVPVKMVTLGLMELADNVVFRLNIMPVLKAASVLLENI
jgi:hypothetical protein